jgi:hypothetical protein
MNAGPDVERRISDWLAEEVPTRAPDRILPTAFERSRQTRQRRFGAAWRSISMNRTWQLATAAVVGLLIIVLGAAWLGGSQGGVGGPAPAATPSPIPSPTPTPQILSEGGGALEPGRRYAIPSRASNPAISFTVPSGWSGNSTQVGKEYGDSGTVGPFLFAWPFDHGFKDPCTDHTPVSPAPGSGAAGLLGVIADQSGIDAGPVTAVTVGGHAGSYVDYTVTTDTTTCAADEAGGGFWIWGNCPAPVTIGCEMVGVGDRRYGVSKNDRERAYAIDDNGKLVTFFTAQPADLSPTDRAELQQVLDSIGFEPAN